MRCEQSTLKTKKIVDVFNSNALWWACERGHVEVVALLKQHGALPRKQPAADDDSSGSGGECFLGGLSDSE
jgi:ankyrin repeat protein